MVCLVNNHFIRKESDRKQEQNIVLISYRLEQLEQKVDHHNNLIERTYELEKQQAQTDEKVKVINHRIADLEGKGAQA